MEPIFGPPRTVPRTVQFLSELSHY